MRDIRIERWAHTLVHYSLYLKEGETIAISSTPLASPLIEAVYSEVLHVGAYPVVLLDLESLGEILLREGNESQLTKVSPATIATLERADAHLNISASSNPRSLNGIDPARIAQRRSAGYAFSKQLRERESAGKFRWSGTLYPTNGYAQDAGMSLTEFEAFVFDVCFLNDPDPIARWK
ncbi:MAG TPA: aminopeptidase, partial [Ktedonobacteraceae bacterium]|nr:aminopeptidase [Ktedonobacteraceae bacterium]